MFKSLFVFAVLIAMPLLAQARTPGSATVETGGNRYLIPIECEDAGQPWLGFGTEPNRITRERTGRSSMVRLTRRTWKETELLVVSLDRYVAWVPVVRGSPLEMTLDMSPSSVVRDGIPKTMTFDQWQSGDRPEGINGVRISANCANRDPDAPAFEKL